MTSREAVRWEAGGRRRIRDDVSRPGPRSGVPGEPEPGAEGDGLGVFAGREQRGSERWRRGPVRGAAAPGLPRGPGALGLPRVGGADLSGACFLCFVRH